MESMLEHAATGATMPTEAEAYETLLARAHRKTGTVAPELVVRHVLSVTGEATWPVRREALEALLRRIAFGKADGLQIVSRPAAGGLLGLYMTRRKGSPARPYRTLLRRVEPIEGSCDCADFLRSSLGLCKHLLVVLEDVASFDGTADEVAFERSGSFLSRIEQVVAVTLPRAPDRGAEAAEPEDGPAEREIDAVMAAGDEARDARVPTAPKLAPSARDLQDLFSGLKVQRTAQGGLVIEAPPETAATLATLFAGMAQLLQAAAAPPAPSRSPE
jgi:hypothetical protein